MSQTDDAVEFNELAKGNSSNANKGRAPSPPDNDDDDDEETKETGEYVQWARNGQGLIPVGATYDKLAPAIYEIQSINDQLSFVPQKIYTDSLIRLPDSKSDEVISEIEKFWTLKDRFYKFGFSYKRGFLLYGPPGSGKTSTVSFVMKQTVKDGGIVLIVDGYPQWATAGLQKLRKVEPNRRALVILEDIDTLIQQYGESPVLSLLDGEDSVDNVVFIATTNYPENLDGRIINRPSRFDRVVKIGTPNKDARLFYLKNRNINLSEEELEQWASWTEGFSIAHLKELVVCVFGYGNKIEDEIARLRAMAKLPKSQEGGRVGFGKTIDYD